jgi:hypothetical protein
MVNADAFWTQVALYNEALWPIQLILTALALILTFLVFFKPGENPDLLAKAFFAFSFALTGVVFFLIYVKNPISTFFGAPLFILLAVLFTIDGFTKRTEFKLPDAKWKKALTFVWVLLVFMYPIIGLPLGHTYPRMLTPVMPCPLTVFALALVTAASPTVDRKIFILLLPWALAGLPKCFGALDCYEDCILFAAGVYGLIFLVKDWKAISLSQRSASSL